MREEGWGGGVPHPELERAPGSEQLRAERGDQAESQNPRKVAEMGVPLENGWWQEGRLPECRGAGRGGMGPGPHCLSTASWSRCLGGGPHAWLRVAMMGGALKTRPPDSACHQVTLTCSQERRAQPRPRPAPVNTKKPRAVTSLSFPSPPSSVRIFCDSRIPAQETRPVARSAPTRPTSPHP